MIDRFAVVAVAGVRGWRARTMRFLAREDGQAVVELALVLPILLVVLLGIFDFGRAVNYWNDENHLAEVGARYAAVGVLPSADPNCSGTGTSSSALVNYIACEAGLDSKELQNGDTSCNGTSSATGICAYQTNAAGGAGVCVSVPTNAAGQEVTVRVAANYNFLPLPKFLGGSFSFTSTSLTGTATMRLEQPLPSSWITTTGACA
jgi:Flp pilus assembly protein TadG